MEYYVISMEKQDEKGKFSLLITEYMCQVPHFV